MSRLVTHNVVKETTMIGLMATLSGIDEKPSANKKVTQINCLLWRLILMMRSAH